MTKRLIALLISVMMVVTLLPAGIFAEDATDVPEVPEVPEVAAPDYEHITVRTEGVNQAPQQMTAGTALNVVGGDKPIDKGAAEQAKPTDATIGAGDHPNFKNCLKPGAVFMRSANTWLVGYAVKVEGLTAPAVATVNANYYNHSGVDAADSDEGWQWDAKNKKISIPADGTYLLLVNGATNTTRRNRTGIAYVNTFTVSMSADATVTFLGEAEAAIADLGNVLYDSAANPTGQPPEDMSLYANTLSVQYVDNGETKSVEYEITDGYYPVDVGSYDAIRVDDEYILGMLPKFPEKVSEDGKNISRHIGWSKTEGSAKAEEITVLDKYGLINTPLYPVWFTTPDVEAPAAQVGMFSAGEVVTLPKGEAGTLPTTTVWKGNALFSKNDTDPGYDGLTMVFKVDGADTPVFTGRVNPTTLNKNGAFSRTEGEGDKYAYDYTWGAAGLDYPKADGTQGNIPAMYIGTLGNGYFYMYWNAKALYMQNTEDNPVRGMTKLDLFDGGLANDTTDFGLGYNNNDNATFQMLAVVAGNLDVNVNFVVGDEVHTYTKKYTDFSGFGAGSDANCATRGEIVSADDAYASLGVALPEPPAEPGKLYRFYWADEKGNPVEAIYKSQNLYPVWEELFTKVVFLGSDGATLEEKVIGRGAKPEYTGEEPVKAETDDATYVFAGWSRDGETVVDLANEKLDADEVVYKPVFAPNPKIKASLEPVEALSFNKAGKYKIKLNYTDITTDVLAGTKTPITGGTVNVTSDVFANANGEKTFDVTFNSIDENGLTNAEITLTPPEFISGTFSVTLSGTVTGEGATATLLELTENIAVTGQQPGKFYGESAETVPLNKNNGDTPPEAQLIWQDEVRFGEQYTGVTFVLKATGIETPVILSNTNPTLITFNRFSLVEQNDSYKYRWFYSNPFWGNATTSSRFMQIDGDGYYLFYINSRLFDLNKILGAKEFKIFFDDGVNPVTNGSSETTVKTNTNENAALQMVAVVAGDLQPTVTFHDAEGDVITSVKHDYTTVGMNEPNDGNLVKQTMQLMTAQDIFGTIEGAEIPVKTPEAGKEYLRYDFKGWAYEDGTLADGIYMNADLYPAYDVVDTRPDCTIKFMNGDEEYDTQIIKETELPVFPELNPTKPSTDEHSYIFKGWDVNGDGVVDEPAPAVVEGATYTAVYEEVERRWEVKFYAEDKETYLGSILVLGEIKDGTTPTAPEKPADVQYTYTFDKWVDAEGNELVESEVTQDISVYPSYTSTINQYTVTFLDDDGTELAKVTVDYGTAATVDDPTKAKDEYYTYTFSGWDVDISNVVGDMTATATYSKVFTKFDDVPADEWYTKQVEYVTVNKYFSGMTDTTFEPDTVATRAMVLRVLYSAAGNPSVEGMTNPFKDVPDDEWYAPAVIWGFNVGVAYGKSDTEFDPDTTVLREEFCSFIYRFAEKVYLIDGKHVDMSIPKSDVTSSLATFKDKNDIDSWAQGSIRWCKYARIVRGTDTDNGTFFYPLNGLTRAELATMIKGFFESDKLVPVK